MKTQLKHVPGRADDLPKRMSTTEYQNSPKFIKEKYTRFCGSDEVYYLLNPSLTRKGEKGR